MPTSCRIRARDEQESTRYPSDAGVYCLKIGEPEILAFDQSRIDWMVGDSSVEVPVQKGKTEIADDHYMGLLGLISASVL
jgi:hypothetical protein